MKQFKIQKKYESAPIKIRDRAAAEEKLIAAGLEVFSRHGADGATTKLISQASGVNESLIIRYFGSKEGLLLAILNRFIEQKEQDPLPYAPQSNLKDELLCYVKHEVESIVENKDFIRVLISKTLVDEDFAGKIKATAPVVGDKRLEQRLKTLQSSKIISKKIDVKLLNEQIGFHLFGVTFLGHMLFNEKKSDVIKHMNAFIDALINGVE